MNFTDPATGNISKGYREEGYLPEAFINMVALLGWSPADDKEILSLDEMTKEFDLNKVHKAGARFSKEKAEWFNHQYIQLKSDEELLQILKSSDLNLTLSDEKLLKVVHLMKERATFPKDIYENGKFFFEAPSSYDEKASKKAWNDETSNLLTEFSVMLSEIEAFTSENIKQKLHDFAENKGVGMGKVMMPLRLALVGELKGPDVPDIVELVGKEESIARINNAINNFK